MAGREQGRVTGILDGTHPILGDLCSTSTAQSPRRTFVMFRSALFVVAGPGQAGHCDERCERGATLA